MTITEAICHVLKNFPDGLTSLETYKEIIDNNLYEFGAQSPVSVVNAMIRRRCVGLDFPSAFPVKLFEICGSKGNKPLFKLLDTATNSNSENQNIKKIGNNDALPEEKISKAHAEHVLSVQQQVFDLVLKNSPAFFEHLVVDLLLKMGYGYDQNSGIVVGNSHDGGIDGIINEDKLGLDLIYIQAKRYATELTIGRKELQAFVGAMENVQKGVFITTSKFSKEAIDFVKRQQKRIKLIDGTLLADLLVKYQIGINVVKTISLYKVDTDYYGE